jgi:hypothetical protein
MKNILKLVPFSKVTKIIICHLFNGRLGSSRTFNMGLNSSIYANGAFKLIPDTWTVLSDTRRRMVSDKRSMCGPQVYKSNYNANVDDTSTLPMSSVNGLCHQNSTADEPRKVPTHLGCFQWVVITPAQQPVPTGCSEVSMCD